MNNTLELINKVTEGINKLRDNKYSCSQATLIGISRIFKTELAEEELNAVSVGFRGGIGRTYDIGPCGALSAGTIALGIYLPAEKATVLTKELFNHFKKVKGTVLCGEMVKKGGFTNCTSCCICVGEKVAELLSKEKVNPVSLN